MGRRWIISGPGGPSPPAHTGTGRFRVIACPRSGTRYTTRLFLAAGKVVGHERDGVDGTVSCFMAVDDFYYWAHVGPRLSEADYPTTLHQVRHPLKAIAAMTRMDKPAFWHWQSVHTGITLDEPSPLPQARFWLAWNRLCREQADYSYRIEAIEDEWPRLSELVKCSTVFPSVGRHGVTSGARREVTWDELKSHDPLLAEEIREEAGRYGYEV